MKLPSTRTPFLEHVSRRSQCFFLTIIHRFPMPRWFTPWGVEASRVTIKSLESRRLTDFPALKKEKTTLHFRLLPFGAETRRDHYFRIAFGLSEAVHRSCLPKLKRSDTSGEQLRFFTENEDFASLKAKRTFDDEGVRYAYRKRIEDSPKSRSRLISFPPLWPVEKISSHDLFLTSSI